MTSRHSEWMGPAFPEHGWVPAPRYLMRRARIHALSRDLTPGRLLEIGPGAGTLLIEFARKGFRCEGLELSAEARQLAARLIAASGETVRLHDRPGTEWEAGFDTVFAFEVLEHIEHDAEALATWRGWLRPGGTLLLSVPARMSQWNAGDEWAGHFRRYERAALKRLLTESGFAIERFECYGFPLANLTERVSARRYRRSLRVGIDHEQTRRMNNDRSGVDREPVMGLFPIMNSLPGRYAMQAAMAVQRLFLGADLGSGYIVRATACDRQ